MWDTELRRTYDLEPRKRSNSIISLESVREINSWCYSGVVGHRDDIYHT
jgi:hypothetical protein